MKLLTLFPPTLGIKDTAKSSNWPFFAYYCSNHRFAAAIAAQEVCEARYKAKRMIPGLLAGALLAGVLVGSSAVPYPLLWDLVAILLFGTLSVRLLADSRKVELLGQAVECVVRRDTYATPLDTALDEASKQLTRYKQFRGWPQDKIRDGLVAAVPDAERWAGKNAKLIRRAV
jgi:hypothetical protein